MFRTPILLGLLLTAALAGCLSDEGDDVVIDEVVSSLSLGGCVEHFGALPVAMDQAQAMMPEGFAPVAFDDAGLFATEYLIAYTCANLTGDAEGSDVRELSGGLLVMPSENFTSQDVHFYGLPYGILTESEDAAEVYASWGLWTSVGPVEVTTTTTPAASLGQAMAGDADFTVRMQTIVTGDIIAAEAGSMRLFAYDENLTITGAIDVNWTESTGQEGQALVTIQYADPVVHVGGLMFGALPAAPGFGFHYEGEGYGYTLQYVPLEKLGTGTPMEPMGIRGLA